jgi:Fic family protein
MRHLAFTDTPSASGRAGHEEDVEVEFLTVSRAIMKSPSRYYRSFLYSEHDDEDLTYSLLYQLDATKRALTDLREYLRKKQDEQRELARTLRAVPDVNHRQRALLDHALKNPDDVITFLAHSRTHNVTLVTARHDVLELVERKLLEEVGHGRQRSFLPTEDITHRLSRRARTRGKPARKGNPL